MGWFKGIAKAIDSGVVQQAIAAQSPPPAQPSAQPQAIQGNVVQPQPGGSTQISGGGFSGMMNQLVNDANIQSALEKIKTGQSDVGPIPQAGYNPFVGSAQPAVPQDVLDGMRNPEVPTAFPLGGMLTNANVLPELGYGYVGPGNAPANVQPINQAPALSPQQAMQFLGGQNPFIRSQEQGIGSLFRRLMQQ